MKSIIQAMLEEIYMTARRLAVSGKQTAGEKNDYYVTLVQLDQILQNFEG